MSSAIHKTSEEKRKSVRMVPFNFEDLELKAKEYLDRVKSQAQRLIQETHQEVDSLRKDAIEERNHLVEEAKRIRLELVQLREEQLQERQEIERLREESEKATYETAKKKGKQEGYRDGHAKGYEEGKAQGLKEADQKIEQEAMKQLRGKLDTLMPALQSAVEDLSCAQQSFLVQWEKSAVHVSAAIAQRAISRQLPQMLDVPMRLLREALELAVGCSKLKIRLNPKDLETLEPQIAMIVEELAGAAETEIVGDHKISPGGCVLETSLGSIDQRIESRLERIKMELV